MSDQLGQQNRQNESREVPPRRLPAGAVPVPVPAMGLRRPAPAQSGQHSQPGQHNQHSQPRTPHPHTQGRPQSGWPTEKTHELRIHPDFERDLQGLARAAGVDAHGRPRDPRDRSWRMLERTLQIVKTLQTGRPATHSLDYMPSYPDVSDCETSYVGIDRDEKPTHRLVWRELPPEQPGRLPVREVIALGERQYGAAYHLAGTRLGRPKGVTLQELRDAAEPIRERLVDPERVQEPSFGDHEDDHDAQFE